jgi:hypothetical protein
MNFRVAIATSMLLMQVAAANAQIYRANKDAPVEANPSVTFTLSAEPTRVRPGEAIRLTIKLTNTSTREILVLNDIGTAAADYDVVVRDSRGEEPPVTALFRFFHGGRLPSDPSFYSTYSRSGKIVHPDETIGAGLQLDELFDLSRPDVYTVSVERLDQTTTVKVRSNAIEIAVIE